MKKTISLSTVFKACFTATLMSVLAGCAVTDLDDSQIVTRDDMISLNAQEAISEHNDGLEIRIGATQDSNTLWLDVAVDTVLTPKAVVYSANGRKDRLDASARSAEYDIIGKDTEWTYFSIGLPLTVLNEWVDADDLEVTFMTEKGSYKRDLSYKENPELKEYLRAFSKKLK